jgi:predicted nucleic acid-binding protein
MNGPADQGRPARTLRDRVPQRSRASEAARARAGHHRLPFPDLLIAAIADRHVI